jgi:hypothetical protein
MDVVKAIASVPTDEKTERPTSPQVIKSIRVIPVTALNNPYMKVLNLSTVPVGIPPTPAQEVPAP